MTRILDHCRTTDPMSAIFPETKPVRPLPRKKGPVGRCDGCLGPRVDSNWSNARRNGRRFCSHSCLLLAQAAERGGGQ